MFINDHDPVTDKYVEKTKTQKIKAIMEVLDTFILPGAPPAVWPVPEQLYEQPATPTTCVV